MRTRVCLYVLLLLPLAVYWQSVFQNYGTRNDYSGLQQAREEPGRLVRESGAQGRPVYGAIMETSFSLMDDVALLRWLRVASVLLLTLLGLVIWRQLYAAGWSEVDAAAVGAGVALLPSAQVAVTWVSGWPLVLTWLLAVAGFSAIETEIERGGLKRVVALLGGCMIYTAAGLVDQASVLFALVIVVAVLLVRTGREPLKMVWWCSFHLGTLFAGLFLSLLFSQVLIGQGIFQVEAMSPRTVGWLEYLQFPLPNAIALYALNDDNGVGGVFYWGAGLVVFVLLVLGFRRMWTAGDVLSRSRVVHGVLILAVATLAVCFLAERATAYRAIPAMAGIVWVLLVYVLRVIFVARKVRAVHYVGLAALGVIVAVVAHRSARFLVANPQAREWAEMQSAVLRADFSRQVRVHVVTPTAEEHPTNRTYGDEFGIFSSSNSVIAQDMFKAALRERFPDRLPRGGGYTLTTSNTEPTSGTYDLLIDLRMIGGVR